MLLVLWAATFESIVCENLLMQGVWARGDLHRLELSPHVSAPICQQRNCFSPKRQCEEPQMNDPKNVHCFLWKMENAHGASSLNNMRKCHLVKTKQIGREEHAECLKAFALSECAKAKSVCVCVFILRVSIFFADCDNNGDDHCLLGIIDCESVTLPFCSSYITVMPLLLFLTSTHKHTQANSTRI